MFFTVFKHYLKRACVEPMGILLYVLLPVGLVVLNNLVYLTSAAEYDYVVYSTATTNQTVFIAMLFQLIGGTYIVDYIFLDFKSERRWRLLATPVSLNTHFFAAIAASIVFLMVSNLLILGIGHFFFYVYLGNFAMIFAALFFMALFAQLLGVLLSLTLEKKATASIAVEVIAFVMSFGFFVFAQSLPVVGGFLSTYGTPFSAGMLAINRSGFYNPDMGGAFLGLGILIAFTAVMACVVAIIGRRRPL